LKTIISENEKLKTVISALPDLVFILTESGRYADIFGGVDLEFYHDGSPLIGKSLYDVLDKEKADWFREQIRLTLQEKKLRVVEYNLAGEDVDTIDKLEGPQGEIWFEGRVKPLPSVYAGERAVVWVARNVTAKHLLEMELRQLSEIDPLTGIGNRRKLLERLQGKFQEYQRYRQPTCYLLFDIDDFKSINDRYGHLVGDHVLRKVARMCDSQLRSVDLIGRLGGDEFGVILANTSMEQAASFVQRLDQAIGSVTMKTGQLDIPVTISIGTSEFRVEDKDIESIISRADNAMYQVKQQKKQTGKR